MPFRTFRSPAHRNESSAATESIPFLSQDSSSTKADFELGDLEQGRGNGEASAEPVTPVRGNKQAASFPHTYPIPKVSSSWRIPGPRAWRHAKRRALRVGEGTLDGKPYAQRNGWGRRSRSLRCIFHLLAICLMLLGVFQLIAFVCGALEAFFPDNLDWVTTSFREESQLAEDLQHWPTDFTRDIQPITCHSHNDYWRTEPLFSALRAGCASVEADVWLFDEELYVGHSLSSLTPNRTLKSLYINPILDILEKQNPVTEFHPKIDSIPNGVFDTAPTQSLVLLIDYKTDGEDLWPYVQEQLAPLRQGNYLTHFNGTSVVERPITVVATGNAPFELLVSDPDYRDIFFDAPLDEMDSVDLSNSPFETTLSGPTSPSYLDEDFDDIRPSAPTHAPNAPNSPTDTNSPSLPSSDQNAGQGHSGHAPLDPNIYTPHNSYYASVSFSKTIGFPWRSRLSHDQLAKLRAQIRGAHAQGLKVRYWSIPAWPRGLRNYIWRVLVREGVDVLSVDDLSERGIWGDWGPRKGGWGGKWWG